MARRRKPRQGDVETNALANARWSAYNEQQRLQEQNHPEESNIAARELCSRVLDGGYQCDEQFLLWLWSQK